MSLAKGEAPGGGVREPQTQKGPRYLLRVRLKSTPPAFCMAKQQDAPPLIEQPARVVLHLPTIPPVLSLL